VDAAEAEGVAGVSSMDGAWISPPPTAMEARASMRPSVSGFCAIIGGLWAKGFFALKFLDATESSAVPSRGRSPTPQARDHARAAIPWRACLLPLVRWIRSDL
jgi:hypothetical protein